MKTWFGFGILAAVFWLAACVPDRSGEEGGESPKPSPSPTSRAGSNRSNSDEDIAPRNAKGSTSGTFPDGNTQPSGDPMSGTTTPNQPGSTSGGTVSDPSSPTSGTNTGTNTGGVVNSNPSPGSPSDSTQPGTGWGGNTSNSNQTSPISPSGTAPNGEPLMNQPGATDPSGQTLHTGGNVIPGTNPTSGPSAEPEAPLPADIPQVGPVASQARGLKPDGCSSMTVVNTGGVGISLRDGAGAHFKALDGLGEGQLVTPTGSEGAWVAVQFNGKSGYVYKRYLECQGAGANRQAQQSQQPAAGAMSIPNCL